jgi:hypothetical protein
MNRLIGVLAGLLLASAAIADENDFRCLKSVGLKSTLRLQFVFQTEKEDVGYVRYQTGSGPVPVKRMQEKVLFRSSGGRPAAVETQWSEITAGGTTGTYAIVSQGARISEVRYLRKDGKMFRFEEDLDASTDKGCEWPKK